MSAHTRILYMYMYKHKDAYIKKHACARTNTLVCTYTSHEHNIYTPTIL